MSATHRIFTAAFCRCTNNSRCREAKRHPILLRSATTTRLVWRVLRGELQAGFGVLPIVDKALWIERVAHEPFCVCLAEHHRLAAHSRLAARELSNETLVWIPRSIHRLFYDQIVNYLLTLKFSPGVFWKPLPLRRPLTLRHMAQESCSSRSLHHDFRGPVCSSNL